MTSKQQPENTTTKQHLSYYQLSVDISKPGFSESHNRT